MDSSTSNTAHAQTRQHTQVAIIGAGPSGSVAGALLKRAGIDVTVLERSRFPRFSIGESLLPQSMEMLEEAGLLEAIEQAGFQYKNGAAFRCADRYCEFDFREKSSAGPGTTFQVQRANFDQLLADAAAQQGVPVHFEHTVNAIEFNNEQAELEISTPESAYTLTADFILDASGYGRVLPRLLDLEQPSPLPHRSALFTHIEDRITDPTYDRNKILISVHPTMPDIWYWLIPFSNGRCSLGVVGLDSQLELDQSQHHDPADSTVLQSWVAQEPKLKALLEQAQYDHPVQTIRGYSCGVSQLAGDRFALLGNAGEFLDPVFSSGVTIALKSASLAAHALIRRYQGETVDWATAYTVPLMQGVNTFRTYVEAWYDGRFQDVIFYPDPEPTIKAHISSILAGYAWDKSNPYVVESERRLNTLATLCRETV
ncbi:FAD-dependent oxidoreductase [Terasakiispira papahanaumokuakeensis]|uniref:FAD-dependent oxidoreductase n=1 Tax=Terasakiispira papahanaumokuakeensis TaxID=197479 RepID=A0A1E2VBV6_9GAMM|nr:NAD(P)/FAD-dependent oxidoreductase [Terasakiispira papahanaumokuakeensis]ODC04469.1 FAD-dependent oxidoreductase [Terasakiispira papahanaumokuakeensis]